MPTKYKRGDIAYIVESNIAVREVEIVQVSGDFAIIIAHRDIRISYPFHQK